MALDLVAPIPALRQNFVAGLRFDQEVQYQVQTRCFQMTPILIVTLKLLMRN